MPKFLYIQYPNFDSAQFAIDTQYTNGFPIRGGFKTLELAKLKNDENSVFLKIEVSDDGILDESISFPDTMEIYRQEDIVSINIISY